MPFTVSCTACNSRFLLGDDLFRRKVSGNIVTVKCRKCEAEISVDARDVDTLLSHKSPRRAPAPPRPKHKLALIAPKPAASATSTPTSDDSRSIWDSEQTAASGGKSAQPESIDFEEISPSSTSDAPPLGTLTHEPGLVHPPRPKKKTDEFLVNLSAGTGGILGGPTIDISSFAAAPPPEVEAFEIHAEPPELSAQRARIGTMPLFDMSAVLPAASSATALGSAEPTHIDFGVPPAEAPPSAGKTRERAYVVSSQTAAAEAEAEAQIPAPQRAKRGGVFVWFGVAALAFAVLLFVGMRGPRTAAPVVTEPAVTSALAASSAAPSPEVAPPVLEAASALPEAATAAPSAAPAVNAAPSGAAKNIPTQKTEASQAAKPEATVATEKPAETEAVTPITGATPAVEARKEVEPAAPGTPFDKSAAVSALQGAAAQASSCRKDGDPSGTATLTITFAESGRVTSATIQGPPFAGTATGGCIASTMRHASIPAFDGDRVTVTKTVVIE